jgi:hypothetical protein
MQSSARREIDSSRDHYYKNVNLNKLISSRLEPGRIYTGLRKYFIRMAKKLYCSSREMKLWQ